MSIPRFLAGPISFGLNAGLAVVAGQLLEWEPSALPTLMLFAWGGGLLLATATLKVSWPIIHTSAAGLLLLASITGTGTVVWPLPLAGAAAAIAMARFASVGFASRWLSRSIGIAAIAVLAFATYLSAMGDLTLGADGTDPIELIAGAGALLVIAILGLWHPTGEDE